jgi:hypothetical protein
VLSFFEHIVEQCQKTGLVWGKELYFDGTQVEANADSDAMQPRFYVEAMQAHLAALFPDQPDQAPVRPEPSPGQAGQAQASTEAVPDQADQAPDRAEAAGRGTRLLSFPSQPPQAEEDDKLADDPPGQDWISRLGRPANREKNSSYQRIADLRVSTTDPDATLMHKKGGGGSHLGYHTHYVVDGGRARIILHALVTPSEVQDNQPMLDLLWRACFRWRLRPKQVTEDTKYGTIENLKAIEDAGMRAYIPLRNFEDSRGVFGKQRFKYEEQADQYRCP